MWQHVGLLAAIAINQYNDLRDANISNSIAIVQSLPLKYYTVSFDSVPGRRHLGLTGHDVKEILPASVTVLPKKKFPNPEDHSSPLMIENYHLVDLNQVFMHNVAATQQLVAMHGDVGDALSAIEAREVQQNELLHNLTEYLQQEASIQLMEKRRTAEADAEKVKLEIQLAAVKADEERKTNELKSQSERDLADYKEELEVARAKKTDELSRERNLELVQLQEEAAKRAEFLRRETEEHLKVEEIAAKKEIAELDREAKLQQISAEAQGRQRQERENEDVAMRKLLAQAEQDRQQMREAIEVALSGIGSGLLDLITDKQRLTTTLGALIALAAGVFAMRETAKLIARQIEKHLGRPSLVRETSRRSGWQAVVGMLSGILSCGQKRGDNFADVVLPPEMKSRVEGLSRSVANARRHRAPFRHLMLYGPPGTGKTMVAKRLARGSGLDYAIMSGGDVGPLGSDAVTQLHAIFNWANTSTKGLLLFIDEAEAFLGSRARQNMSETQRNALNALLYQTGEQSYSFMMVLATNRPGDLDTAVTDRVDEALSFDVPGAEGRLAMLRLYFEKHVLRANRGLWGWTGMSAATSIQTAGIDEKVMAKVAQKTAGFSGREIAKLMISVQGAAYGSVDGKLTAAMFEQVVEWKVAEHRRKETQYEVK